MESSTNVIRLRQPDEIDDPLTEVLRVGARRLLAQAVEMEAEVFLAALRDLRLPDGREPCFGIKTSVALMSTSRVMPPRCSEVLEWRPKAARTITPSVGRTPAMGEGRVGAPSKAGSCGPAMTPRCTQQGRPM